ncbi:MULTISPECIES: APC family permease [unclassified Bilifractor]|uniref:APC family permease n=1 Tax=unclassified Bilifractor TaxID=2815795 RepID=UPI003F8DC94F
MNRNLKFKDVLVLAFSTMIGWGWVALTGNWVDRGGTIGAVLAFVIGAVLCIFVGLTYCELTPALPYSGGELVFTYKALGYHGAWFSGWMIAFAYIGVAAWEGPALVTAIDYLITIPRYGYLWTIAGFDVYATWLVIPVCVGALLCVINTKGIKISTIFQAVVTTILAVGGIGFAIISGMNGSMENMKPLFTSTNGMFSVVLAVPAMFVGFDVIPQVAEEMNLPLKKIPAAIVASILLAAGWYIMIILASSFAAPNEILGREGLSVVNAVNYAANNPIAGKLIVVTAIMGILSSWNGFIIGATRVLYSMGRAKMLPDFFGKLHKKYHTPGNAIVFIGIITILTPLLGKNSLGWFVDASAFGTVIAYLMVAISFVILRRTCKDLPRPFRVKHGMIVGMIAVMISLFFVSLYLPVGSSSLSGVEWVIVGVWVGSGMLFYLLSLPHVKENTRIRENALFGKSPEN